MIAELKPLTWKQRAQVRKSLIYALASARDNLLTAANKADRLGASERHQRIMVALAAIDDAASGL